MAVYYKFKSAKDYDSISIDGHFISVGTLKEKIYESKQLGRGTDYDLVVTNAQTNEEYLDEEMLIPKNTSVLIRRIPGQPRMPIVTAQDEPKVENKIENVQQATSSFLGPDQSISNYLDGSEYDEFGNDLYEIPEVVPVISSNSVQDAPPPSKADEDDKIKALIDTPALDWQRQNFDGFGPGRGFGRGMGGRMGGRGFGRGGFERKTPPEGYICHRCKTPGHFIQHCPTNGDPNFDIKRVKPPTGIPKSMLMATPDGSYALPSGAVAVLRPNEAAFEKEIEGMPSTRTICDLPPELHCPLCKEVMKDAVLTSKCCFQSFCDKCIRDHIISKSVCVCGATNVLADDLLPNKTLRDTINRILESNNSSAENGGSAFQAQDMQSALCPQPKIPSPSPSVASKGEQAPPQNEKSEKMQGTAEQHQTPNVQQPVLEKGRITKVPDVSEATHESRSVKEPASQGSTRPADEEVQQKQVLGEAAKKKKKKKVHLPMSAAEMQWRASQDFAAANYMMPPEPSPYNPYWNGMQPGMEAYFGPYGGAMPYMGYGLGPMDVPFGGLLPQDPFGVSGYMMPPHVPPQRDLADFGMGFNGGPPIMSREEFEARKAELKRKRELERRGGSSRELSKDREFGREVNSNGDISSMKLKSKPNPPLSSSTGVDHQHSHRQRTTDRPSPDRRSRDPLPPPQRPSSKRKSSAAAHHDDYDYDTRKSSSAHHDDYDYDDTHHRPHHHTSHRRSESYSAASRPPPPPPPVPEEEQLTKTAENRNKHKPSVFSRISFPEGEEETVAGGPPTATATVAHSKKRKVTSSEEHRDRTLSNGYHEEERHHHKTTSLGGVSSRKSSSTSAAAASVDYESSDEDRHFKRRSTKERERDRGREERVRDGGGYSKHR